MSCSCNHCYSSPCCCPQNNPTTTTTTFNCTGEPCDVAFNSDCVIYQGPNLDCYGITTGSTVTEIINIIISQLIPCTTTSSTTTTTTEPVTP